MICPSGFIILPRMWLLIGMPAVRRVRTTRVPAVISAVAAEQNNAGCSVRADVLNHAFDSAIEKHDFAVCYIVKPVNDSYAVADGECKADLLGAVIKSETGNILAQQRNNL